MVARVTGPTPAGGVLDDNFPDPTFSTEGEDAITGLADVLVDAEAALRAAADATLNTAVNAEAIARTSADTTLTNNLAAEVTNRAAAVTAEAAARAAADTTLTNNLASEVTNRTADVNAEETRALAAEATEASARAAADSTLTTNLATEVTNRTADVNAEETRALLAESGLASDIAGLDTDLGAVDAALAAEVTNRTNADATLTTNLAAEVTNRTNDVNAEETRALAAEASEASARATADTTLTTNLAAEVTNRVADVDAEQTRATAAEAAAQAFAVQRANHTGAQAIGTVTGLQTALDAKEPTIPPGTYVQEFLVEKFLPASPTPAQTRVAIQAAIDAADAFGNGARVVGRPGATYLTDAPVEVGTSVHVVMIGAEVRADSAGAGHYLLRNKDRTLGNAGITVDGGVWDARGDVLPANGSWIGEAFEFVKCDGLNIRNLTIKNALKYCILHAEGDDLVVDNITFDTLSDGLHMQGPSKRARITNLRGTTGDDFLALTTGDYAANERTAGSFTDIQVDGVFMDAAASGVSLVGRSPYVFDQINIANIHGTVTNPAVRVIEDPVLGTAGFVKSMTLKGIHARNASTVVPLVTIAMPVGELHIEDYAYGDAGVAVNVAAGFNVAQLSLSGLRALESPTGNLINAEGTIGDLLLDGIDVLFGTGGRLLLIDSTGGVTRLTVDNFHLIGASAGKGALIHQANGASALKALFSNGIARQLSAGFTIGGTASVYLSNVELDTIANYPFNVNNAAGNLSIFAGALTQISDNGINKTAGSMVRVNGTMYRADASILTAQIGDSVYNTNAALAIGVGPARWNGTAWSSANKPEGKAITSNSEAVFLARDVAGIRRWQVLGDATSEWYNATDAFPRTKQVISGGPGGYSGMLFGNGVAAADAGWGRGNSTPASLQANCNVIKKVATQTRTGNGAVSLDAGLGDVHIITLAGNATSLTITGRTGLPGQILTIGWLQDATGSRTYAWGVTCFFAGGNVAPTPSTAPGRIDFVTFYSDGTNWLEMGRAIGVGT